MRMTKWQHDNAISRVGASGHGPRGGALSAALHSPPESGRLDGPHRCAQPPPTKHCAKLRPSNPFQLRRLRSPGEIQTKRLAANSVRRKTGGLRTLTGDRCRPAPRRIEASKVAICNGRFTSTLAVRGATMGRKCSGRYPTARPLERRLRRSMTDDDACPAGLASTFRRSYALDVASAGISRQQRHSIPSGISASRSEPRHLQPTAVGPMTFALSVRRGVVRC
jgi:hypothetical protein